MAKQSIIIMACMALRNFIRQSGMMDDLFDLCDQDVSVRKVTNTQIFVVLLYVVIGGGLALNDTGFILVQATCPTSSLSWSVTLFLSPSARSLQWGYKQEEERWGVQEVRPGSGRKGRE